MTDQFDPRSMLDLPDLPSTGGLEPVSDRPPSHSFTMVDPAGHRHLVDYLKVLYKRRRLVLSVFVIVVAAAAAYTYTRVPIYEARVKLLIDTGDTSFVDFREVVDPRRSGGDYYQTQYDLLRS